jgi:hypothetical protein
MDSSERELARQALLGAERNVTQAINLARQNKNGDALRLWRDDIFGPLFPLS